MFTVDLHTHTRFFHGFRGRPTAYDPVGATLLALCARRRGLDAVAVTNHDYHAPLDALPDRPRLIPGIEVTTTRGHVLVVGPDPPSRTAPGELTPHEAVALAHERDCAAVIAHPFRRSGVTGSEADFDAVEINGKHPQNTDRVRELADALDLPAVGGSDAHFPFEVGRALTTVRASTPTAASVATAIREGRVEPSIRGGFWDSVVQEGYRHVHRYWR